MTENPLERDADLRGALIDIGVESLDQGVDWTALRRRVGAAAALELQRRRRRQQRRSLVLPVALAAGLALFVFVSRPAQPPPVDSAGVAGQLTIDEMLDADVSDDQFRALLAGANEANDLLLIAAQEERQ